MPNDLREWRGLAAADARSASSLNGQPLSTPRNGSARLSRLVCGLGRRWAGGGWRRNRWRRIRGRRWLDWWRLPLGQLPREKPRTNDQNQPKTTGANKSKRLPPPSAITPVCNAQRPLVIRERLLFQLKNIKGKMSDSPPENEISDGAEEEKNWWAQPHHFVEENIRRDIRVNLLPVQIETRINRACCSTCPQPRAMHLLLAKRDFVPQRFVLLRIGQFSAHT
jgi:hypothetical protein